MGMSSRRTTRAVLVLLALTTVAALIDGAGLWRQQRWNALIASDSVGAPVTAPMTAPVNGPVTGPMTGPVKQAAASERTGLPAQVQFAQAHALAASGADQPALNRYRALQAHGPLGQAAAYNSANLLLRQALVVRAGTQPGQAIALIELAKELYRDVLRADPQHWDARYNLDRAQRLLPDPDEALEAAPPDTNRNAERAATTMRGYSPGLP